MRKVYLCKDCGVEKSKKGIYCRPCSLNHRTRRSGLKYNIKTINKGWIKRGQRLSPETEFQPSGKPFFDEMMGYFYITHNGVRKKYHRHIMEQHIGRQLLKDELVHHINLDKKDNRIENLTIMTRSEHNILHWSIRRNHGK